MLASPRSSLVTRLAGLAAVATLAALGACNPYDPDLGDSPFRCGTSDPKCPDGYECMVYSDTLQLCERGADTSSPDARIDGSGLTCNDDSSVEPNDDINTAWTTPIPDFAETVTLVSLAICPDTDKDLFRFRVDSNGKNMRATVTTEIAQGQLLLQVLNNQGLTIANGTSTDSEHIVVVVNNLAVGTYFVQVAAPAGVRNNYQIDIKTCDVSGCP
ncbi:MAG: hypothetical protein H6709_09075 [Kofleriaceae bacterium]|nr:hypothetical protein [Myxococcales bacterium]MCB9563296.1 hypothetical protein [Kofleriaceae bacterium]MCB9572222.1 hypothetical protein [Kofleriaceae bacterium]